MFWFSNTVRWCWSEFAVHRVLFFFSCFPFNKSNDDMTVALVEYEQPSLAMAGVTVHISQRGRGRDEGQGNTAPKWQDGE